MKGYFRIRLLFGTWTILYYDMSMNQENNMHQFESHTEAATFAKTIDDYMDADKSDLPVGNGKQKSGNLA